MRAFALDRVAAEARSDVGRVRTSNQDAHAEFERADARLFVVADGMGGHRGGETASRLTVEVIGECFAAGATDVAGITARGEGGPEAELRRAIHAANLRVYGRGAREPELHGMGTTVVCLWLGADGSGYRAHVGDSRLYRLREGTLEALTDDHTLVGELERGGYLTPDEAARHPQRNVLVRSVGPEKDVEVDTERLELQPGDRYLLCSDGLCGYLEEHTVRADLGRGSPGEAAEALVARANEAGGEDNVTVLVVELPAS